MVIIHFRRVPPKPAQKETLFVNSNVLSSILVENTSIQRFFHTAYLCNDQAKTEVQAVYLQEWME